MKNVKAGHTRPIVCLDAGHYGKYNRSPAVPEYYESEMNWKLHLLLKAELEKYGVQVKLTRSNQAKDMELYDRGAASKGCDLFLSIHSNAAGSYVAENIDYPVVYVQLDGKGDTLGKQLATAIEQLMATKQKGKIATRKGNRGEYYGVLRGAAAVGTTGLILEHSFHTNTKATKWLMNESNLQKMAQREAEIIAKWFDVTKTEETKRSTVAVTLPVIYPNDKNEHVEVMQALLIGYGYNCGKEGVDGSNGQSTQKAIKQYQADSELEVDGYCGSATWGSLLRQKK
jgi:N-acetylmuramoyl-L-alanine amidase